MLCFSFMLTFFILIFLFTLFILAYFFLFILFYTYLLFNYILLLCSLTFLYLYFLCLLTFFLLKLFYTYFFVLIIAFSSHSSYLWDGEWSMRRACCPVYLRTSQNTIDSEGFKGRLPILLRDASLSDSKYVNSQTSVSLFF